MVERLSEMDVFFCEAFHGWENFPKLGYVINSHGAYNGLRGY